MAKVRRSFKDTRAMFEKVRTNFAEAKDKSNSGTYSDGPKKKWTPIIGKDENEVEYVVRFLPDGYSESGSPFIQRNIHSYGPYENNMYDRCRKALGKGEACYICDQANPLFKSENPVDQEMAYSRYSKRKYIANVLIVKDARDDGANEGKVFMYEFGKKIWEKLDIEIKDDFIYYDPELGANFTIKVKRVQKYPNYDSSHFERKVSAIADSEEKINEILDLTYDLTEENLNPEMFASYDEQKVKYTAFDDGKDMQEVSKAIYKARESNNAPKDTKGVEVGDAPKETPKESPPEVDNSEVPFETSEPVVTEKVEEPTVDEPVAEAKDADFNLDDFAAEIDDMDFS